MAEDASPPLVVKKLAALALIIVGLVILASGYRYDSLPGMLGGCLVLAIGILLLVMKVVRRNRPGHP